MNETTTQQTTMSSLMVVNNTTNTSDIPDDIVWSICLFIRDLNSVTGLLCVSKQWNRVLSNDMFWREKVLESNWMMDLVPQDMFVMSPEGHARMIEREKKDEEEERNRLITERMEQNGNVPLQEHEIVEVNETLASRKKKRRVRQVFVIKRVSEQLIEHVYKTNRLCKTFLNDWISYWTSNFDWSDSEESADETDAALIPNPSVFVFKHPVQVYKSGVAVFGEEKLHAVEPGVRSRRVDHNFKLCYVNMYRLMQMLPPVFGNHSTATEKSYEWTDPSLTGPTTYPLIPFISYNFPKDENLTLESFTKHIGAHHELHISEDVYRWKSIELEDDTVEDDINSASPSVKLRTILPEEGHQVQRNFVTKYLKDAMFCMLGQSQLNPVPVFIVGILNDNAGGRNICGLFTATFRSPV